MSRLTATSSQFAAMPSFSTSFPANPLTISYTTVVKLEAQQGVDHYAQHAALAAPNRAEELYHAGPGVKPRRIKRELTAVKKEAHRRSEMARRADLGEGYRRLHAHINGPKDMFSRDVLLKQAVKRLQEQDEEIAELRAQLREGSAPPRPKRPKLEVKVETPSRPPSPPPAVSSSQALMAAADFANLSLPAIDETSEYWEVLAASMDALTPPQTRPPSATALPLLLDANESSAGGVHHSQGE